MDPFLGEIRPVPYSFAPTGWALCQGQIMSIAQNTALFSLLGTTFGGNGTTTFGLPDLRGTTPLGAGNADQSYVLGEIGGEETVSLNGSQIAGHTHQVMGSPLAANNLSPVGAIGANPKLNAYGSNPADTFAADAVAPNGQNAPHNNIQPYLAINYIIALQGIYPQRP